MTRRAFALALALAAASAWVRGDAALPTLSFAEVTAGQQGTGHTVFAGEEVAEFQVEILGKLEKIGPGRNLILARLSGGPLERTGVLAGMSGSPVYVDGKLVGAVAFTWGFGKEPIAGITPIETMRRDAGQPLRGTRLESAGPGLGSRPLSLALADPLPLVRSLRLGALPSLEAEALQPVGLALSSSGLASGARATLTEMLPAGTMLLPGGSAPAAIAGSAGEETGASLRPGDAVGVRLVDGDLDITAIGTVTEVDGSRVLAFGHPLLGLGEVELPMTRARVETLVPSLSFSFKISSSGEQVGAFLTDLPSGAGGRLGTEPRMVPVRVELPRQGESRGRSFSFRVASDPLLTPPLLFLTLSSLTEEMEPGPGAASFRIQEGSTLLLEDGRQVNLSFFYSGEGAGELTAALVAIITQVLLRNEYEPATLAGVNLSLEHAAERQQAALVDLIPERLRVRAGETLQVSALLQSFRGETLGERFTVEIPGDLAPGPLVLLAGDALQLALRESEVAGTPRPRSLDELIRVINNLRSFDSLYLVGLRREAMAILGAEPLPHLPPSRAAAFVGGEEQGATSLARERALFEEVLRLDLTPRGLRQVRIEVLPALGDS
jgi:hypothetical protein